MHFKKKVCLSFFSLQKKEKERVGCDSSSAKLMHGLSLFNSTYWLCALYAVHFPLTVYIHFYSTCAHSYCLHNRSFLHSLIISHPKLEGKKGATVASINLPNSAGWNPGNPWTALGRGCLTSIFRNHIKRICAGATQTKTV